MVQILSVQTRVLVVLISDLILVMRHPVADLKHVHVVELARPGGGRVVRGRVNEPENLKRRKRKKARNRDRQRAVPIIVMDDPGFKDGTRR